MPKTPIDPENISPYKLLDNFSKNRVLPCIFFALIIHVVVIGGLSSGYIYTTWINPTADQVTPVVGTSDEDPSGETSDENAVGESGTEKGGDSTSSGQKSNGDNSNGRGETSPVVKRVTETEDPANIPDDPGGPGISLDE